MRRKDREVVDKEKIRELLDKTKVLHLALFDESFPYIVPLNYGYEFSSNNLVFYLHSAHEGLKIDLIKKNPNATIELDYGFTLKEGNSPCQYGAYFSSLIARGKVEIIETLEEKIHGLKTLMKTQTGRDFIISEEMTKSVTVIKFTALEYTVKANNQLIP